MALLPTTVAVGNPGHIGHSNQAYSKLNNATHDVKADYGAAGDGTTNDRAAIQAAIDAATAANGGVVYFPPGTYKCSTALVLKPRVRLTGSNKGTGSTGVKLVAPANDLFTCSANTASWEIDHLFLDATGGHCITNSGFQISDYRVHDCEIHAHSTDKACLFVFSGGGAGGSVEGCFDHNNWSAFGATRTVPALSITDTFGGFVNANVWEHETFTYEDGCNNQWFVDIQQDGTSDFSYTNTFRDCVWEICNGGSLRAYGQHSMVIENCWNWDTTLIAQNVFHIGKNTTGLAPRNATVRNSGRIGNTLNTGVYDLWVDSSCLGILIESFRCINDSAMGKIHLNSASDVTLSAIGPSVTVDSTAPTYAALRWPIEFLELAADPAAPAVNGARLYTKDNGAGKTQLCVRFNTGVVQVIASQP